MSHTYHQLLYHIVWSTKERCPFITSQYQNPLYRYIKGILNNRKCPLIAIGGMPDHIHLLVQIPPREYIPDVIKSVKVSSNKWIGSSDNQLQHFSWQEGYGIFSVSKSSMKNVVKYINDQEEHHRKRSFVEEFLTMLDKAGIEYNEKYLWK